MIRKDSDVHPSNNNEPSRSSSAGNVNKRIHKSTTQTVAPEKPKASLAAAKTPKAPKAPKRVRAKKRKEAMSENQEENIIA